MNRVRPTADDQFTMPSTVFAVLDISSVEDDLEFQLAAAGDDDPDEVSEDEDDDAEDDDDEDDEDEEDDEDDDPDALDDESESASSANGSTSAYLLRTYDARGWPAGADFAKPTQQKATRDGVKRLARRLFPRTISKQTTICAFFAQVNWSSPGTCRRREPRLGATRRGRAGLPRLDGAGACLALPVRWNSSSRGRSGARLVRVNHLQRARRGGAPAVPAS